MERRSESRSRRTEVVVRVVGGVLTAVLGIPLLALVWLVLGSFLGPPSRDPHGYAMIFGTLLAMPFAFATAAVAPLVLPRRRWALGYGISAAAFVVVTVALLLAWFVAT